jgi:hypothetical protein
MSYRGSSAMSGKAYMYATHLTGALEAAATSPRPRARIAPASDLPHGV